MPTVRFLTCEELIEQLIERVPDLFLPIPKGDYHGLWIELKVKPNKPTQNQLLWLGALDAHGYACKVCYGFAEAAAAILSYIQGGTA